MQDGIFAQMTHAAFVAWQKAASEQVGRTTKLFGRVAAMESKTHAHTTTAIEEWSSMVKESLAYQSELSAEWRKLSLAAMQKMAFMPPASPTTSSAASASTTSA